PGFVTNFKNKKVQTNLENSTSIFGDEPSQKIIPGFVTNFKNKKVQTNLENSTNDLVNQSFESGDSKTHIVKETEIINSFPTSNTSIETSDIFLPNNNREVNQQKNDSEIYMREGNTTKVTFSENNKSNKTGTDLESLGKKIKHNNEIDILSLDDLSVLVTFPEPILQNNNYSSQLLVLDNSVPVTAAKIYGEISSTMNSNYTITFIGETDNNGIYNFPLKISNLFPTGEYNLKIIITKSGSHNSTFSTTFFISPHLRSGQDLERSDTGNSFQIEQFEGKNNNNKKSSYSNNLESKVDQNLSLSSSNYDNIPFSLDEFPILK
ncbi:MAG: hypothetical protein R3321_09895, partial [Nitrososphaeraceae archaeon]|nr:hypothetical protein [Nitrososphaeraceae archaeon]